MTLNSFVDLIIQHWVVLTLVLCPIVIVLMALAALSCEACGAPFGVFRRRNRTIDLCLRCALLHDIRQAKDTRKSSAGDPAPAAPQTPASAEPGERPEPQARPEDRRQDRRFGVQPSIELEVAGHRGPH